MSAARLWAKAWPIALVAAISRFYVWTAVPAWRPGLIARHEGSYYSLLARGILRGHLYLDARADPFLATLKNPWDPAQRGDHGFPDASYYRGRYYLYYGVTPVFLLFLPFRLLTGNLLGEALGTVVFAIAGFALSAWLLLAVRRRHCPRISGWLAAAGVLALGLGDMVPVMLRGPSFREIPIACGYACVMAALAALFQALHSRRSALWLAAAGAALALAVGSRPLYLLACPAVLVPLAWDARARRLGRACWRDRRWRGLAAAALAPMAAVGLGLALYNYFRFGSPWEFGLRYQLWNEDPVRTTRFAWRYATYNLRAYWLAPAGWSRFFPFVNVARLPAPPRGFYGAEDPFGIFPNMPFALLALGALGLALRRSLDGRFRALIAAVALAALPLAAAMVAFQAALNRYMVDFLPALVLLAALGLFALAASPAWRGAWAAAGAAAAALLAAYSSAFNVLASLRHDELLRLNEPALYRKMAHAWNQPSYAYDRWAKTPYGPLEMRVVFPADRTGGIQTLVATGRSFLSDYLFVHYLGPDSLQFGLEHTSRGIFWGAPLRLPPGRPHVLRIDLGSLYPPPGHPYFDRMSPAEAQLRQDTARVLLDGEPAFFRTIETYEAAGPRPDLGRTGAQSGFGDRFSGRILSWRRLPGAAMSPPEARYGALRLELTLPPFTGAHREPIASLGGAGTGHVDLFYLSYESAGEVALGYEHPGWGDFTGPKLSVSPEATQVVEIDSDALHPQPGPAGAERSGRISVRLNGRIALAMPAPYFSCDPDLVSVGFNPSRNPAAGEAFVGTVLSVRRTNLPAAAPAYGAVRLRFRLPPFTGVRNEPLVCAGATGRGDLVYVRFLGPRQVQFGYDHWNAGGPSSAPVTIDPQAVQDLEVDFGSLHPARAGAPPEPALGWPGRIRIRLNGRAVMDQPALYYVSAPGSVALGLNPIQTSTAVSSFTGELVEAERAAESPEAAAR